MPIRKSIVAIIGTTGAGKSRLAVDIARTFHGEVINGDAMQVYRGLDIITNKIPHDARCGVPHHLLGCKPPDEEYVVGHWVSDTVRLIEDMHARNVLPVIVGGTAYWIQHLLFPNPLLVDRSKEINTENTEYSPIVQQALASLSGEQRQLFDTLPLGNTRTGYTPTDDYSLRLHTLLSSIDPDMASRWHWRDSRRILRNLQVIKETGQRPSEIVCRQDEPIKEARYPSLILWPFTPLEVLNQRLDDRVHDMAKSGLIHEIHAFNRAVEEIEQTTGKAVDRSCGIFKSIGYKEFHAYLAAEDQPQALFDEAIHLVKQATRRYAASQVYWIRKRLLPAANVVTAANPTSMYSYIIDTSEYGDQSKIRNSAMTVVDPFVNGGDMPNANEVAPSVSSLLQVESQATTPSAALKTRKRRLCEICTTDPSYPVMLDEKREWERHCKSWRHQYLVKLKVRGEEEAAFQDVQSDPFPARVWVEVQTFSTRTAWNPARRMRAARAYRIVNI